MAAEGIDGYRFERDLIDHLAAVLREPTPWMPSVVGFEFDYGGGAADVLALGGELVAFEGKLTKWREALHQAYRTRCFAQRAYVVVPASTGVVALRSAYEFARRGVGLCAISKDHGLKLLIDCESGSPLQSWITARAIAELTGETGSDQCQRTQGSYKLRKRSAPRAA